VQNNVLSKIGKESVTDRGAFKFYRDNQKHRDMNHIRSYDDYRKLINDFYLEIANDVSEKEGGVFIKGLGYFTVMMHPKKQVVRTQYGKAYTNFKTKNHLFTPTFIAIAPGYPNMNFWVMDRMFSKKYVKTKVHKALMEGKKYKTYMSTLYSMYGKRQKY